MFPWADMHVLTQLSKCLLIWARWHQPERGSTDPSIGLSTWCEQGPTDLGGRLSTQGFMQSKRFAGHIYGWTVDTWMITYIHASCDGFYDLKYGNFQGIADNIYDFFKPFLLLYFLQSNTCPLIFLPIHNGFYLSKWWADRSLHKVMFNLSKGLLIWATAYWPEQKPTDLSEGLLTWAMAYWPEQKPTDLSEGLPTWARACRGAMMAECLIWMSGKSPMR